MDSPSGSAEPSPTLYVGQHEAHRPLPVSDDALRQAQDCNYDMLTSPISTSEFHSRIFSYVSSLLSRDADYGLTPKDPLPMLSPLSPAESPLEPSENVSQLLATTCSWIDIASSDPLIAHVSRQVLNIEIAYAAFCGVVNVIVQGPPQGASLTKYSRALAEAISLGPYLQLHVYMPISSGPDQELKDGYQSLSSLPRARDAATPERRPGRADDLGSWDAWNVIRSICKYNSRLSVALHIPRRLPSLTVQARWYSEPVRLLFLPGSSFVTNARGSHVLSKAHQLFLARYIRLRNSPWLVLSDVGPIPGLNDPNLVVPVSTGYLSPTEVADAPSPRSNQAVNPTPAEASSMHKHKRSRDDPTPHLSYIRYLQRNLPQKSIIERFGAGYQDYLQSPLQPLTDNLESITYEVFEKDPIKYEWYERAIAQALSDWSASERPTSSSSGAVVVAVVGAGRGPLVTRAIQASKSSGVGIELYAVEKNPNAYVLLQRHNQGTWQGQVRIVKSDMRNWKGPRRDDGTHGQVDILISELLGSFGDNELSPECLDGVQHVLNPEHGISIPSSYTAHLTPIAAPKLYADIQGRSSVDPESFNIPYVVMLHAIDYLSLDREATASLQQNTSDAKLSEQKLDIIPAVPDVQTTWSFAHPIPAHVKQTSDVCRGGSTSGGSTGGDGANEHNTRFAHLVFRCQRRGVCHGLAGYFETVLYEGSRGDKVELSTNPTTMEAKSRDMISWFPIFFPLKAPLYVTDDAELEVSMWRLTDDRKVWYEWLVEAFATIGSDGQRIRTGMSELHSSKKNGCLM